MMYPVWRLGWDTGTVLLQELRWAVFLESESPEAPCVYAGILRGLGRHGP